MQLETGDMNKQWKLSDLEKQLSRMDGIMSRMNGNGRH